MRMETIVRLVEALIGLAELLTRMLDRLDGPKAPKDGEKKPDGESDLVEFC